MKALSKRLEEAQLESKRHFENFVTARDKLNEVQQRLSQTPLIASKPVNQDVASRFSLDHHNVSEHIPIEPQRIRQVSGSFLTLEKLEQAIAAKDDAHRKLTH